MADPGFFKRGGRGNGYGEVTLGLASKAKNKCVVFFWKKGGGVRPHAPPPKFAPGLPRG